MTWALPAIAAILLVFAAISGRVSGTSLTAPMVFTAGGLVLGAHAAGLIDVEATSETVKLLAEVTLALVLFADASRVNLIALRAEIALPARLLGIGLPPHHCRRIRRRGARPGRPRLARGTVARRAPRTH